MAVKRMKRVYRVLRGKSDIFMVKTLVVYQLLDITVEVLQCFQVEHKSQLALIKSILRKKGEEGFTLLELVVVVAVLAVLSAIAIPYFTCIPREAKASAAIAAMKQIQKECITKTLSQQTEVYSPLNLKGYQIQSDGSNGCYGNVSTGIVSAIPDDTNLYPTFNLEYNTSGGELSYSFKGQTGSNFKECIGMICTIANSSNKGGDAFKKELEANAFVQKDTYFERGCSAYVLVDGPNWSNAQANAKAIGGNLATINDEAENDWIIKAYKEIGKAVVPDKRWPGTCIGCPGGGGVRHIFIGLKRGGGTGDQTTNGAGFSDGWISGENSTWRPPYWGKSGEFKDADGNIIGTNLEGHQGGADYTALNPHTSHTGTAATNWNDFPEWMHTGVGMAELPLCDQTQKLSAMHDLTCDPLLICRTNCRWC